MTEPTLSQVRACLIDELNSALRRPGMYGGEISVRIILGHVALTCGTELDEQAELLSRGAFSSTGVNGAFAAFWSKTNDDMTASVYAEIARKHGWLHPDRLMSTTDYDGLSRGVAAFCRDDKTISQVLGAFGQPSLRTGGSNLNWPQTIMYMTGDPADPCLTFHCWNWIAGRAEPEYAEPMLLAVRRESRQFDRSFTCTPTGRALRAKVRARHADA